MTTTPELEAAARAMARQWFISKGMDPDVPYVGDHLGPSWETWVTIARAGFQSLLPPTDGMVEAAYKATDDDYINGDKLGWHEVPLCITAAIRHALGEP